MASEGDPLSRERSSPALRRANSRGSSGSGGHLPMASPSRLDESSSLLDERRNLETQCMRRARDHQQRQTGGVMGVPGRIIATLQRKFWDSNKVWAGEEEGRDTFSSNMSVQP